MYKNGDEFQNDNKRLLSNYKYQIDHFIARGTYGMVYKVKRVYKTHSNLDVEVNLNKLDLLVSNSINLKFSPILRKK
jgi:hypothetical protein